MSVNVARIFEETFRLGLSYCRFCLRTSLDTTLVTAHNAYKFAKVLKLSIFENKSYKDAACIYCEAMAATALRFYEACVNAVTVKSVGTELKDMKNDDPVPTWLQEALRGCNKHLKDYRKKTHLQQTEVLVVDSSGIEWPSQAVTKETKCRINVPRVPATIQKPAQPQSTSIETVVLDDDDDETTAIESKPTTVNMPKLVPIEKLLESPANTDIAAYLPNQMQVITKHNTESNSFILHPIVVGKNKNLEVPSLGGEIINGQLIYNANILQNLPLVDCTGTPEVLMKNIMNNTLNKDPLQINTNEKVIENSEEIVSDEANSILAKYLETNIKPKRTSTDKISDNAKKKREEYIVDLDVVNNMLVLNDNSEDTPLPMISQVTIDPQTPVKKEAPIAMFSNVISNNGGMGMITEVKSQAEPKPIEKTGKIDWEDKIPMDVISFMDATDPMEREFILPDPSPVKRPSKVIKKEGRKPKNDVIDLC